MHPPSCLHKLTGTPTPQLHDGLKSQFYFESSSLTLIIAKEKKKNLLVIEWLNPDPNADTFDGRCPSGARGIRLWIPPIWLFPNHSRTT